LLKKNFEDKLFHLHEILIYRFFYINPKPVILFDDLSFQKFLKFFSSYNCIYRKDTYGNIIVHFLRFDSILKNKFFLRKLATQVLGSTSPDFYITESFISDRKFMEPFYSDGLKIRSKFIRIIRHIYNRRFSNDFIFRKSKYKFGDNFILSMKNKDGFFK